MTKKFIKFLTYLLAIILICGSVVFLLRFVNKDDSTKSDLSLSLDGKVVTESSSIKLGIGKETTLAISGVAVKDLKIKVVPHISKSTNFTFTVDDVKYAYSKITDLTDYFSFELSGNNIVVFTNKDLPEMIAAQFSGNVQYVPSVADTDACYMDMVFATDTQSWTVPVYLYSLSSKIVLDVTEIVF